MKQPLIAGSDDCVGAVTHTPGPWEYVPGSEHHGPYVVGPGGGDICDCYAMSNFMAASIRNGGTSFPINHQGDQAEANARLIAAAPDLLDAARLQEAAEDAHANCDECEGEGVPELCEKCFPLFDDARVKRRTAIAAVKTGAA